MALLKKDWEVWSGVRKYAADPLGPFGCVERVSRRGWSKHQMSDKQTHTEEFVLDLNVIFQIKHQTFYAEDNKKVE